MATCLGRGGTLHGVEGGQGHGSPEQLVVEHAGLVAGPVVLELRDVVVEGAEGVSAHQQRRALPPAQPEVLPTNSRASYEGSRKFHNHIEGLFLVGSAIEKSTRTIV